MLPDKTAVPTPRSGHRGRERSQFMNVCCSVLINASLHWISQHSIRETDR
jgi:hypothetical protein